MKKLYTTILIIAVALFISCNEEKARDDITEVIEKIGDKAVDAMDAVDKVTPKQQGGNTPTNIESKDAGSEDAGGGTPPPPAPTLTKPVLSKERAPWSEPILFPKVAGHTYALKEEKTGVTLSEGIGNIMQITATQSAQNVIIVATFDGTTSESNPIEFTRIQGNTLSFTSSNLRLLRSGTRTQTASKSGTVAGDTRNIKYSVSPTGRGVSIDSVSGEVTASLEAKEIEYTITAELQQNAKYIRATATYTITVQAPVMDIVDPFTK